LTSGSLSSSDDEVISEGFGRRIARSLGSLLSSSESLESSPPCGRLLRLFLSLSSSESELESSESSSIFRSTSEESLSSDTALVPAIL